MNLKFDYNWSSWNEIDSVLQSASNKEKGDLFELLTKYYFLYSFQYQNYYDDVWLGNDIPQKVLDILGLPKQDLGIDLIAKYGDEYHAIQCKYHGDTSRSVTFNELSTFLSLYASSPKLTQGFVCSTADHISPNLNKVSTKPLNYLLIDTWEGLSEEFFQTVRNAEKQKVYRLKPFLPRPHQSKAIKSAKKYFKNESRGKLIFPCGSGKSLTGYWITEALKSKRTLVAVPSLSLIKQTLEVYLREVVANNKKVKWLCICSDDGIGKGEDVLYKTNNIGVPCHTDRDYIKGWLEENSNEDIVVFTTYQSGKIISDLSTELNLSFDVGIYDEAHKTVGPKSKLFSHLLFDSNITVEQRVFMTATQRFYSGSNDDIMSMDDLDVYGDVFAEMSFKEAIKTEPQLLTDYKVVTIEVTKNEIASFIKENHLINIDEKWGAETESRSLASMIALRKAMNKLPIHNAVSFHSSIAKAKRCKEIQPYIDSRYDFEPIDTYTVSGKIPTTKRNQIVNEFASSNKALITNSRCLTEGVDVPKIDCIVFSDPRKSQVDIVQALGRALRVKEGKEYGYVIIPVIYDEETNEIDNKNFSEIVSIVQGLSSNDRRIIDYFKMASETKKSQDFLSNGLFEVLSDHITEDDILNKIEIKIWEKLARGEWMPFEEARAFVRSLKLASFDEYIALWRSNKLKKTLPSDIRGVYKNKGFISVPDFLGYESLLQEWLPFVEARAFVRSLNLKTQADWYEYRKNEKKQLKIPSSPNQVYRDKGWVSLGDWLGTGTISTQNIVYRPFNEARDFARKLNLSNSAEWRQYVKTDKKPFDIPANPNQVYKNKGWVSMGDWLGTNNFASHLINYLPFNEARDFARKLNLSNSAEWRQYVKTDKKPFDIPANPNQVYKNKGWVSMGDWLGTNNVANHLINYLPFKEARDFVHSLGFKTENEWLQFTKTEQMPKNIPAYGKQTYKDKGYLSMSDWLGTGKTANHLREYLSFSEARDYVRTLKLKSNKEWRIYSKSGGRPDNIPGSPEKKYKDKGWKGFKDWLGTDK